MPDSRFENLPRVKVICGHTEADDGETTHYGGEIRITNSTNVDIAIKCHGTDRGDDNVYVPTMNAVADVFGLVGYEFWAAGLADFFFLLIEPYTEFEVAYNTGHLLFSSNGELTVHPAPPQKG